MDGNGATPGIWSHPIQKKRCSKAPGNKSVRQWPPKKTDLPTCHMDKSSWCLHCENAYKSWITTGFIHPGFVHLGSSKRSYGKASNTSLLCCAVVLSAALPALTICHHFSGVNQARWLVFQGSEICWRKRCLEKQNLKANYGSVEWWWILW